MFRYAPPLYLRVMYLVRFAIDTCIADAPPPESRLVSRIGFCRYAATMIVPSQQHSTANALSPPQTFGYDLSTGMSEKRVNMFRPLPYTAASCLHLAKPVLEVQILMIRPCAIYKSHMDVFLNERNSVRYSHDATAQAA